MGHIYKKTIFSLDKYNICAIIPNAVADVAHLVERHLAKVEVASSSLVIRSKTEKTPLWCLFCFAEYKKRLEKDGLLANSNSPVDCLKVRVRAGDGSHRASLVIRSILKQIPKKVSALFLATMSVRLEKDGLPANSNSPVDCLKVRVRAGDGSHRASLVIRSILKQMPIMVSAFLVLPSRKKRTEAILLSADF